VDQQTLGLLVTLGLPALGGVIWLIRLEGRVNYIEKVDEQRSEAKQSQIDALKVGQAEIRTKHEHLDSRIFEEIARLREMLAELKGILKQTTDKSK